MSCFVVPPTIGVNASFDSPKVPWHDAHCASQIASPSETEPDPGGRPLKSARTSMSQAWISERVAGRPMSAHGTRWPASACAPFAAVAALTAKMHPTAARTEAPSVAHVPARMRRSPDLDIEHLARVREPPRLDRVVVIGRARAAARAHLVDLRLHRSGLVDGAALQHRGRAVPDPVDREAGERLRQHEIAQPRRTPVAA